MFDLVSDGTEHLVGAVAPLVRGARRSRGRDSRESHDDSSQDPNTWSESALRAFLANAPSQTRALNGSESREELVKRCYTALGRQYVRAPRDAGDEFDNQLTVLPSHQSAGMAGDAGGGGEGVGGSGRGVAAEKRDAAKRDAVATVASSAEDARSASVALFMKFNEPAPAGAAHGDGVARDVSLPSGVSAFSFLSRPSREDERSSEKAGERAGEKASEGGKRASEKRVGVNERATRQPGAARTAGRSREQAATTSPLPKRQASSGGKATGSGGGGGGGKGNRSSSGGGGRTASSSGSSIGSSGGSAHAKGGGRGSAGSSAGSSGQGSAGASAPPAREARRPHRPSASASAADASAAVRHVATWAEKKDFTALINTLSDAFSAGPPNGMLTGGSTSRALAGLSPRSSPAAKKKAFHAASRTLHPDKLRDLATPRRKEAEEVFKALSSAYHALNAVA